MTAPAQLVHNYAGLGDVAQYIPEQQFNMWPLGRQPDNSNTGRVETAKLRVERFLYTAIGLALRDRPRHLVISGVQNGNFAIKVGVLDPITVPADTVIGPDDDYPTDIEALGDNVRPMDDLAHIAFIRASIHAGELSVDGGFRDGPMLTHGLEFRNIGNTWRPIRAYTTSPGGSPVSMELRERRKPRTSRWDDDVKALDKIRQSRLDHMVMAAGNAATALDLVLQDGQMQVEYSSRADRLNPIPITGVDPVVSYLASHPS